MIDLISCVELNIHEIHMEQLKATKTLKYQFYVEIILAFSLRAERKWFWHNFP